MRILQLIDTLAVGGAERMAVNYANALSQKVAFSAIAVTRKEGDLKAQLDSKVHYVFLNKRHKFDLKAALRLRQFCKNNEIDVLHAHGFSIYLAVVTKLLLPRLRIIWHDHYGLSEYLEQRNATLLKIASRFFDRIIAVNKNLEKWALQVLHCKQVLYLPNFVAAQDNVVKHTELFGEEHFRILCLANLRPQKNHRLLLEVAEKLKETHPQWTFHLVGKDFNDDYSAQLKFEISDRGLTNVYLYGAKDDVGNIIDQSTIAMLCSFSEGLPVALLEYGLHCKPVVTTAVGEIPSIITDGVNGLLVPSGNTAQFLSSLCRLIDNPAQRETMGKALKKTIDAGYSEELIISIYLNWLQQNNER